MNIDFKAAVLRVVDRICTERDGFATGPIASMVGRQPGRDGDRQHSAMVSAALRELEREGKVGRMDSLKPAVWVRKVA